MLVIQEDTEDKKKKLLIDMFFSEDTEKYILGTNKHSEKLAELVNINGYINNFTNEKQYKGVRVYKVSNISNKESLIVSCSLSIYPCSAIKLLRDNGFTNIITILEVANYMNFDLGLLSQARADLKNHLSQYEKVFGRLKDDESRVTFNNIINFRYHFDLEYMKNFIVNVKDQYFEDFLDLKSGEVFIDVGGFDGQTSVEFIKRCPQYRSIYIFEPSEESMNKCKEKLKGFKNIEFIKKGLSNKREVLKFSSNHGSANIISESGDTAIKVDTLDSLVNNKVSFIKIDIEGWECIAIEGMRNHILNDHPKMAISVYHKADDFWQIPKLVLSIRHDYDIYMRHYTEGTDETVMFFIPKNL